MPCSAARDVARSRGHDSSVVRERPSRSSERRGGLDADGVGGARGPRGLACALGFGADVCGGLGDGARNGVCEEGGRVIAVHMTVTRHPAGQVLGCERILEPVCGLGEATSPCICRPNIPILTLGAWYPLGKVVCKIFDDKVVHY
jgi:hypothetical protein